MTRNALVTAAAVAVMLSACAESSTSPLVPSAGCPLLSAIPSSSGGSSRSTLGECEVREVITIPLQTVVDLNENAEVLGTLANGQTVVWSRTGIRTLTAPAGVGAFVGIDINNNGQVLALTGGGLATRAILFEADGTGKVIEGGPAPFVAHTMNDFGMIVGHDNVRLPSGTFVKIAPTGPGSEQHQYVEGKHVSNAGVITGSMQPTSNSSSSFTWSQAGGYREVNLIGPWYSPVNGVNEQGHGVTTRLEGFYPNNTEQAYLWNGTTHARIEGMRQAIHLNDHDEVLGTALVEGVPRVVTWSPTGGLREIMERTTKAVTARRINSWGDILGTIDGQPVVWAFSTTRYR